jgi:alpha-mannosidase
VAAVREINAAEEEVGPFPQPPAQGRGGAPQTPRPTLTVDLEPYRPRTLALRLQPRAAAAAPERTFAAIDLPFNLDGVTTDANRGDGDFDGRKRTIAAELLPAQLHVDGVPFRFGPGGAGAKNVLVPDGDRLALPGRDFNRVYLVAAAVGGDLKTTIGVGQSGVRSITVREWQGPVGQWDSRLKEPSAIREPFVPAPRNGVSTTPSQQEIQAGLVVQWDPATGDVAGIDRIRPGYVKRDDIAWIGTHRHAPEGNQVYVPTLLFLYAIDLPEGAREIRLPVESRLRIMAVTAAREPARVRPARLLYAVDLPEPDVAAPRPAATGGRRQK